MPQKIRIGVSSCLLGQKVRYDAQHKFHWYINEILGRYFEYVPVCPELEAGMGVPRNAVRLVGELDDPQMVDPKTGKDWTEDLHKFSSKKIKNYHSISGFILKKGSPSCGVFRVKVYQDNGIPLPNGMGLFARALTEAFPLLPVEEEGRLNDPKLRETFIEKVFAYKRLQEMNAEKFSRGAWVKFHEQHKYLLLSHSRPKYTELGQLVAHIKDYKAEEFRKLYGNLYMEALSVKSTTKKNSDVLQHILGFLKKHIGAEQRADILRVIEAYRTGEHPLIVPVTLLKHYVQIHDIPYIKDQIYLNPHPSDLSLRNHV